MNVEHRTSNVEHRIMYSTIYNKDKAERLPHSTLSVRCSMFKLLRLKLPLNLHLTLKLRIHVRSSEMNNVRALVLTGYGLNCDDETAYALRLAGSDAHRVHINALIHGSVNLTDFQIMVFGGGFSWGDDHGAGVIQAVRMKTNLGDKILEFIDAGNLVIGICNGFQTLVNLGLLPGFDHDYTRRSVALTFNDCGNFRDDWVTLKVISESSYLPMD